MSAWISPGRSSKSTPVKTRVGPKDFDICRISKAGSGWGDALLRSGDAIREFANYSAQAIDE
jgi:hypothetical protein